MKSFRATGLFLVTNPGSLTKTATLAKVHTTVVFPCFVQVCTSWDCVSCLRCHAKDGVGGEAGPDLTGIGGKKDRQYILESIVFPNVTIADGFTKMEADQNYLLDLSNHPFI